MSQSETALLVWSRICTGYTLPLIGGGILGAAMIIFPDIAAAVQALIAIIFAFGVLVVIWWIAVQFQRLWVSRWLLKHGALTTGRVVEAPLWGTSITLDSDEGIAHIVVEFPIESGLTRREFHQNMDYMPSVGDEVGILYDPRYPSRARLAPEVSAKRA